MHAHKRTLLASLGFADPDKENPVHDLACLAIKKRATKQFETVLTSLALRMSAVSSPETHVVRTTLQMERPLLKSNGWKTLLGFADVCMDYTVFDWADRAVAKGTLGCEVKIAPLSSGDLLRQINFYKLSGIQHWCVFTYFNPKFTTIAETLDEESVPYVHIDREFTEWANAHPSRASIMQDVTEMPISENTVREVMSELRRLPKECTEEFLDRFQIQRLRDVKLLMRDQLGDIDNFIVHLKRLNATVKSINRSIKENKEQSRARRGN